MDNLSRQVASIDDSQFVSSGSVKDIIHRLVREVHYLRSSVDELKTSKQQDQQTIKSLRDEMKGYANQIIQLTCENKLIAAEVVANEKLSSALERNQQSVELENIELKSKLDSMNNDNARLTTIIRDMSLQQHSKELFANETQKYITYIKSLEKQLMDSQSRNTQLTIVDEKLRKQQIIIADLLDSISSKGFPVSMPSDYILGKDHSSLQSGAYDPVDCRMLMLVSTVHDLTLSVIQSQELIAMLQSTLRLYEDSTAFVDKLPINSPRTPTSPFS